MSMARQLMTGGYIGSLECSINPARYGHDGGALAIAMESVEELHEIFLEGYNFEQADLAAAIEGVALEGSQYEAVAEAAIKDTFKKIKDFFVKLWNKVKAFFHEVRKYLDSIFMSGKEFAKKYEKEIRKLSNIKDLSIKMFEYRNDNIKSFAEEDDVEAAANEIAAPVEKYISAAENIKDDLEYNESKSGGATYQMLETLKKIDDDQIAKLMFKVNSADDLDEHFFGHFRKNAKTPDDIEEIDVTKSDIDEFVKVLLEKDLTTKFDKVQSNHDKIYKRATKLVDDAANKWDNAKGKGASQAAEVLRTYSSHISTAQGFSNRFINAWKTAVKERDTAYKSAIMAAFSNNRKNLKDK